MQVVKYKYPENIPVPKTGCAAALGFFDGVHLAHREIISDTVRAARASGLCPVVFTFPAESLGLKSGAPRLYTTDEKLEIFASLGVELVILADFPSLSGVEPAGFVSEVLIGALDCRVALAGADFRFGHGALGTADILKAEMAKHGRSTIIHDMCSYTFIGGERVEISATLIRNYLSLGMPKRAALLLGAPYRTRGKVMHGRGDGRVFGYPTVNTELREDCPLKRGVYLTELKVGGRGYTALTNVGVCPSFGARALHAETFIPDFSGSIYGEDTELLYLDYLREERVFSSVDELRADIDNLIKLIKKEGNL